MRLKYAKWGKKVHNFTDLESYYNRQLENVCIVAEESDGWDRLNIALLTKVTLRFEYRICTNFGISNESHWGRNDPLGGLRQGMIIAGSNNMHMFCFMLKVLEEKVFVFRNVDSIELEKMLKIVSAFVDDTDL